jgi:hypothetical protein
MSAQRVYSGEGASLFRIGSDAASTPGLIFCPVAASGAGMTMQTVEQIYQLAYERAQAALRPSEYERAQRPCWN